MIASLSVRPLGRLALGAAAWTAGGLAAAALDGRADLGSQALPLVLAAALAGLCWPAWAATLACLAAALAFNWHFVPPRGTLTVSLHRDVLLLVTMLAVSLGITWLLARQRGLAGLARAQAQRVGQLHRLSEALRQAEDGAAVLQAWRQALGEAGWPAGQLALQTAEGLAPEASALEREGLDWCRRQGLALGPGTGQHENQPAWYLPARGLRDVPAAALLRLPDGVARETGGREHAQALCDQAGQALERLDTQRVAEQARQQAESHALRSTLLASISHDYRTPLAAILGAASSLSQQGERLSSAQRQRLADHIVDEAGQLARLTDNALQLARLDAAPQALARDWESVEELVGAVLRRVRARDPQRRVRARSAGPLPLLRCDAVLLVQALENLIDNALSYSPAGSAVEVLTREQDGQVLVAVRDRGPGIAPAERERLQQAFERGSGARRAVGRGAGLGLALCRAVARAHGGSLTLRPRGHGGLSAELRLPVEPVPPVPQEGP